jgi:hypothetical protein
MKNDAKTSRVRSNRARGVRAGRAYVDVGTLNGYREAFRLQASTQGHAWQGDQEGSNGQS